jgi:tagatose-6-phosphate ketose/aldose isomerase
MAEPSSIPAQRDGGATILEIGQQPDAWHEIAAADHAAAREFLADVTAVPGVRVILTGAGSSAFAGQVVAPALRRHLGVRVDAIATTSIIANPADHLDPDVPTLMVSFGRSGNSPESLAATDLADEFVTQTWHLVLTCDASGALAKAHHGRDRSAVVLMPERTNDTGFAMTSSLTSMMLTCLLLLGGTDAAEIGRLANAAAGVIARRDDVRALAATKRNRFVYLGAGALEGLARESALKLLELTAGEVVTYFDSPLGFRHGPKSVLDSDTLVVVFTSTDAHARRYDLDIIAEIRAQLGEDRVVVLSAADLGGIESWSFPALSDLGDSAVASTYLVVAQYLALYTSLEWGKTPDNPFPGGEVSRVVKGVTIYPTSAS